MSSRFRGVSGHAFSKAYDFTAASPITGEKVPEAHSRHFASMLLDKHSPVRIAAVPVCPWKDLVSHVCLPQPLHPPQGRQVGLRIGKPQALNFNETWVYECSWLWASSISFSWNPYRNPCKPKDAWAGSSFQRLNLESTGHKN